MDTKTDLNSIISVKIDYHTSDLPPPYSYAYTIETKLMKAGLEFDFALTYTDRDEVEEEDIFAEGFTLDDDYKNHGSLPGAWRDALKEQIKKTSWVNNKKDQPLAIQIINEDNEVFEGTPADIASWEYFLQEMMQGVFEVGKKELPLEVQYKEINKASERTVKLQVSFAERTAFVTYQEEVEPQRKKPLPWKSLKKFLKSIFTPDYLQELAMDKIPSKRGKYINPGDGKWYKFGKAILNPSPKVDSLSMLEKQFGQEL